MSAPTVDEAIAMALRREGELMVLRPELDQIKRDLAAETERADRAVGLHLVDQRLIAQLRETLRWVREAVHQAHHEGAIEECPKNTCDAVRQALAKGGGR